MHTVVHNRRTQHTRSSSDNIPSLPLDKDDDDWVQKCMEYEVDGSRPRGRRKEDLDGCERVIVSSGTGLPGLSRTNGR